jgi:hypothetical protein
MVVPGSRKGQPLVALHLHMLCLYSTLHVVLPTNITIDTLFTFHYVIGRSAMTIIELIMVDVNRDLDVLRETNPQLAHPW